MVDKIKVAQIVCTFPPYRGGMGKVAMENSYAVAGDKYDVTVITPLYKYLAHLPTNEKKNNIKIIRLKPWFEIGNGAMVPSIFWLLRKYDILHLHYPFYGAGLFVFLAKIVWRKKLIIHYHMDNIASGVKGMIFNIYRGFALPQMLKFADKVIVHSFDYANNCLASWWLRRVKNKTIEVPNGVDINFYKNDDQQDKYSQKNKQLLFVGSLDKAHYFKGLEVLLASVKDLINKNWHLTIVGNGDMVDYYKDLVRSYRLEDKVRFMHDCDDLKLRDLYRQSYITILPSTTSGEAFGIVLVESMACRTAVLASNLPGVRSVVLDGYNGYLVRPKDSEALRTKIDFVLDHKDIVKELALNGLKDVNTKYNWQSIGNKLKSVYEDIIGK